MANRSAPGTGFERTKHTIVTLLPTIGGIDAEAFVADLHDRLSEIDGLSEIDVRKTGDAASRFDAHARFVGDADDLRRRLEDAFVSDLALGPSTQKHRSRATPTRVSLEFVTWSAGRHHATGRIIANRVLPPRQV